MYFASLLTVAFGFASLVQGAPLRREEAVFKLPPLDYDYNALEPHISTAIMELHHKKHHQAAVDALNKADAAYSKLEQKDVTEKIRLSSAIKFNGGSHINHSLFWKNLAPTNSHATRPFQAAPQLLRSIEATWGSFDRFQQVFIDKLNGIQGSGWGWLGYDATTRDLEIITLPNQDPLLTHVPIIGIDVFEHAYYLQYKNVKGDYFKAIWNVINFEEAERRFNKAISSA